ncbi:hypothetical protein [Spirosoma spitsbergense]|nr:hypothetical protein [Spirosoma spitsbergense]
MSNHHASGAPRWKQVQTTSLAKSGSLFQSVAPLHWLSGTRP